jgi:DtxR family transcriptional regulator, Mn-dependent transcriptional regulator
MPRTLARARRAKLTPAQEDYLKALYQLRRTERTVSTSELSHRLSVSPASAAEMLGKLATLGLVKHDRYRGAGLTETGQAVALEMVRHHRLLEMYLSEALGYHWDEVHDEAERLEHVISERMEERIYDALGRPELDPHGDPIPSLEGDVEQPVHRSLLEVGAGEKVTVRRVSDRDPDKLRALEDLGIKLGALVEVRSESHYEGPIGLVVSGKRVALPIGLARVVYCQ